jgi:PAS domain S-box-containing protein
VETVPQIVWAAGPVGEAFYMSPRAAEYTGLPLSELQGSRWLEIVHPADRSRMAALWKAAIDAGTPFDAEFRLRSRSGDYRWFKSLGGPLRDGNGQVTRWIGTCTDIDDQKRNEEALESAVARRTLELAEARDRAESATRAKTQFLAAMSHEIRTPMNGVIGMANIMLDTNLTSQQRCYMDTIRSSGEALLTVINDVLDLSKIEAGRLELERTPFDLSTLIEEALELVAPQAAAKSLKLLCQVDDSIPFDLVGDPVRLRQIVLNLLSNAVKFTAEGSVSLIVSREANQNQLTMLRFAIRDTGIGLTQKQQEGLFQAFQQADLSTNRRFGGTGLGLSISKRLVEMMGGSIGVHSQMGEGSIFWFNVCLETAPAFSNLECFALKHIALVSNHPTQTPTLCSHLEAVGLRVSNYARIPQLDHTHFDLLVVDSAAVPNASDAVQLCANSKVPVLILGATADFGCPAPQGLEKAVFLSKPVRRLPLLRALQSVLEGKTPAELDAAPNSLSSNRHASVLLAEDNKINQLVARILLERMGCHVDIAENGVDACNALQHQSYDVVLMDCQMPIMSGFEATQRIRSFETSGRRTPIIALTAGVLKEERDRCYASGMDDFLSKPISAKNLEAALEKWIPIHADAQ